MKRFTRTRGEMGWTKGEGTFDFTQAYIDDVVDINIQVYTVCGSATRRDNTY
jgi:hypothetical protein